MSPAEPLNAGKLRAAFGAQAIGNRIIVLEETTSTNDVVAQLASESAEGLVVFAERQTAGRGQYGRRWESAAHKGLWLSVLLRPRIGVAESGKLTDLLVHAIAAAVAQLGLQPTIKPPNDLYVGGRKIAGVLVEMRVEASGSYCAIAGMGINVNQAIADFPDELRESAGSLASALESTVDREAFAISLLRELEARYHAFSGESAARAAS